MERRRKQRRGTLYLAVLGVSTIVSVLALAAMHAARAQLASTTQAADRVEARLLAQSAIEHAVAVFNADANWRTNYLVDTDYPAAPVASGRGSFTWRLASDGGQSRSLSGTASVGGATCTLTVDLAQSPDLDCGLVVGGDLEVESGSTLTVEGGPIGVNGALVNQGAAYGDLEAQSASGSSVNGSETVPGAIRALPTPDMVFDYYEKVGARLTPGVSSGKTKIRFTLLSPSSSFGDTNADGVYVIDSQGRDVQIEFCRIVGTLVVTNLEEGRKVIVYGDVNWEPAYPNYPALLVDGDVEIQTSYDGLLEESSMSGGNYNPAGTPFKGQADSDEVDEYISSIAGLIYCSGNLTIDGGGEDRTPDLRGQVVVGGDCLLQDQTLPTIKYDDSASATPPPGFDQTDPVVIVPGSWR